ncbi:hypothetical protein ACHAXT_004126 [Thalassiosira profunda]
MKLPLLALFLAEAAAIGYPAPKRATCLTQADFDQGTYVIDQAGVYKLCEDIVFGPKGPTAGLSAAEAFDPSFTEEGAYDANEFGLGFFAGLVIAADGVTLHLDGHRFEQSPGHALMQRFFSIIELASAPFLPSVGPAQFNGATPFVPATNVEILGPGTLGLSSHHAIHGNENVNVKISAVTFEDFEVAAVSLNNVDGLEISSCDILRNRQDVPVVGMFSAARFIRPYVKFLAAENYEMTFQGGVVKTAADLYASLLETINNVYDDVMAGGKIDPAAHPEEHRLFDNPKSVIDGPCYAFVVHGKGPAVGGQGALFAEGNAEVTSSNVVIENNLIKDLRCWNNEVPALLRNGKIMNDPRGAVFQSVKTFGSGDRNLAMGADGLYEGNILSDVQIMVAKAINETILPDVPNRQIGPNSIDMGIVEWATNGTTDLSPEFICNADSMHHVVKGVIAIRVEDTAGFQIKGNSILNIENLSEEPFADCAAFHVGASVENPDAFQAGNIRGISAAAVRGYPDNNQDSQIKNNQIGNFTSANSAITDRIVIGIDIQGDSQCVDITNK